MHDASRNYLDKHNASGRPVHSLFPNAVFVFVCNVCIQVEAHVLWHVCGSQSPSSGTQRHFYPLSCSLLLCAPHLITYGIGWIHLFLPASCHVHINWDYRCTSCTWHYKGGFLVIWTPVFNFVQQVFYLLSHLHRSRFNFWFLIFLWKFCNFRLL